MSFRLNLVRCNNKITRIIDFYYLEKISLILSLSLSHQRPSLPLFAINVCLISSAFPSLSLSLALSLFLCLQHLVHIGAILSFTLSGLTSSLSLSLLTLVYCPSLLCTLTLFFTPPQKKTTQSLSQAKTHYLFLPQKHNNSNNNPLYPPQ